MITDPKTVPAGRVGRVVFGLLVGVAAALLMAPQTDEFGTKVALLAGLVVVCALRPVLDRLLPAPSSPGDDVRRFAANVATGSAVRAGLLATSAVVVTVGILVAGGSARGVVVPGVDEVVDRAPGDIDPSTLPAISVRQDVADWNHEIAGSGVHALVLTLAENLELETQAMLRADAAILEAVDHGDRLDEMQARLRDAEATGATTVERYEIEEVTVTLLEPFGRQDGLSLGLESRGTVTEEVYDRGGDLRERSSSPFATTFVLRQATGGRWLNVDVLPLDDSG
jgi:hypothetical protein